MTGPADDPWGNPRAGFVATFSINRSEYGVAFMPGGIGEEVELTVSLEVVKEK
jgi:polyisoprenoid-binding protein YceI